MKKLVLLASLLAAAAPPAAEKSNVLFIPVDDLNDWVGALGGHPDVKTPNLDRLAARGVLFTNAHCAAPACNPSRAALLTGVRPSTSGVYHNSQPWRPVLKDAVTLPQHFMANGYVAVGGGKIFHGGFDEAASWNDYFKRRTKAHAPAKAPVNGIPKAGHFDWGPVDAQDEDMPDSNMVDWAIEFLNRKHEKPFFLAAGFVKPHLPWYVPRKYFDLYPLDKVTLPKVDPRDLDDVPAAGRKMARPEGDHRSVVQTDNWRKAVQGYLASISFMDAQLGRLIDGLDKSPHAANTVVVLWGDHGWHLGEKEHWRKFALWERATKAPLLVVAPGLTRPGGRCDRPVDFMGLYPTLVELCGLPAGKDQEGVSLVPLLKDPSAPWTRPALTTHGRNNHAVRSDRYRYIRYGDGSEELYDHASDPDEWTNLASKPEMAKVKEELAAFLPKANAADAPAGSGKDE
jgi:arylsulfatase A-like enzyme